MMKITRERFCELFSDELAEKLEDYIYDNAYLCSTDSFIINYDTDFEQLYLINKDTLQIVSWYKLTHIGRALELVNIKTEEDLKEFITLLGKELGYEKERE